MFKHQSFSLSAYRKIYHLDYNTATYEKQSHFLLIFMDYPNVIYKYKLIIINIYKQKFLLLYEISPLTFL